MTVEYQTQYRVVTRVLRRSIRLCFSVEIKEMGATDALLVPISKDISQLSMAEEVVSKFNQESSD